MIIIKKEKNREKKATVGCENPYQYAKKVYGREEEEDLDKLDATIGCENREDGKKNVSDEAFFNPRSREKREKKEQKEKKEITAFSSALRILQSGANSSKMLRTKLFHKGFSQKDAEEAIEEVTKHGFVNDRRLLFSHAAFLAKRKYYGKSRIRMELYQKFDRNIVDECFEEAVAELDFTALAKELAQKKPARTKESLVGKLKRNGYTAYEVKAALEGAFSDESSEDADEVWD